MLNLTMLNEAEICQLYEKSLSRDFPSSELKSLSSILRLFHRKQYHVIGAYREGEFVGYALLYCPADERSALLDYLAIEPQHRLQGNGTALLQALKSFYAATHDVLLIECERPISAPDEIEARSRIRFYTKSGAELTSVRIWLFDVEYSILVLPCKDHVPSCNWSAKMMDFYRQMLPPALFEQNVRLIRS